VWGVASRQVIGTAVVQGWGRECLPASSLQAPGREEVVDLVDPPPGIGTGCHIGRAPAPVVECAGSKGMGGL
jgi:hypothetical protein